MGLWVMMMPGMTPITGFGTGFLATAWLAPARLFFAITIVMTIRPAAAPRRTCPCSWPAAAPAAPAMPYSAPKPPVRPA